MRVGCCVGLWASVALVTLRAGTGLAAEPVNLAPNAGFEIADGPRPAFWAQRTPSDAERTLTWDATVARSGCRSLKIESHRPVISRWRTGHLGDTPLKPGTRCRLSGWVQTRGVEGRAHLRLYFMDCRGRILAQPDSNTAAGTADWTEVTLEHEVPEATAYAMIYLELSGKGTAWYDDVVLTGKPAAPLENTALSPVVYAAADFDRCEGLSLVRRGRRHVLELSPGVSLGRGRAVFWGETARYDLAVRCTRARGAGSLRMLVGQREVARWAVPNDAAESKTPDATQQFRAEGIDLQQRSRVTLEIAADRGRGCVIEKVTFKLAGRFAGELLPEEKLRLPPTLRIYESLEQRKAARAMLGKFVNDGVAEANARREKELAALKTPDQWRRRQEQVRARLPEFLGDFGPRCPLNARVTGKLDRPDYTIEKVVFESQPGYHCTANFYVPKRRKLPQPGVLFTCGHAADGKAYHLYHEACLGLVLKGYVVLALDPTGQGERSEYFEPATGKPLVPLTVAQHHYLGRPSWLVGRSLAGYRTWDCHRALDYLVTRDEVDPEQIAVVGNSGGGIMALLATAFDPRIKVCAAAHPGGSMEDTYLGGRWLVQADILSLIPPRPCAIIVGRDSGEEPGHRRKLDEMLRHCRGLGAAEERCELVIVDGVHNMKQPKREAAYAWLNRWLRREQEGAKEPPLKPETVEDLRCTKTGYTLRDLGGQSGQTLNAKVAETLRPPRRVAGDRKALDAQLAEVKAAVVWRLGLRLPEKRKTPECEQRGTFDGEHFTAEKLVIQSQEGIRMPSLLMVPKRADEGAGPPRPVIVHAAELGKPTRTDVPSLALEMVGAGYTVLSIDVRGAGETDPRQRAALLPTSRYDPSQFGFDSLAVRSAHLGTTMLAMRAGDVIRAVDYLGGRGDLSGRPVVLVGEGLGGTWVQVAGTVDSRPVAVVCAGTVPSYKLIVESQYYEVRDYFWTAGALADFDLPDLIALAAPRATLLIDPIDAMGRPLEPGQCQPLCAWAVSVQQALGPAPGLVRRTADGTPGQVAREIAAALRAIEAQ